GQSTMLADWPAQGSDGLEGSDSVLQVGASSSGEVPVDIESAMEDTQDIDLCGRLDDVGDSTVAVEQNPDRLRSLHSVDVSDLWILFQNLSLPVDPLDRPEGGGGIVPGDVVVDFAEPVLGLARPSHFAHAAIRRPISS